MNAITILTSVMFGVYLMNFASAFIAGLTASWKTWARVTVDVIIGMLLFVLFIIGALFSN